MDEILKAKAPEFFESLKNHVRQDQERLNQIQASLGGDWQIQSNGFGLRRGTFPVCVLSVDWGTLRVVSFTHMEKPT